MTALVVLLMAIVTAPRPTLAGRAASEARSVPV
jgi:hypothetical protein